MYSLREQIWADQHAPGRIPVSKKAEWLMKLPPALGKCLGCAGAVPPSEAELLQLKARLAHAWNGKARPTTLNLGGRARSYVPDAAIALRNTKQVMDSFDPPDEALAELGFEAEEALTHAGGRPPRDTFRAAPLPGAAAAQSHEPAKEPAPCAPRFTVLVPPANKEFKPEYGAVSTSVVDKTVDDFVGDLGAVWAEERGHEQARVGMEQRVRRRILSAAIVELREATKIAREMREDEYQQQTMVYYKALRNQKLAEVTGVDSGVPYECAPLPPATIRTVNVRKSQIRHNFLTACRCLCAGRSSSWGRTRSSRRWRTARPRTARVMSSSPWSRRNPRGRRRSSGRAGCGLVGRRRSRRRCCSGAGGMVSR